MAGPVLRLIVNHQNWLLEHNLNPDGTPHPSTPPVGKKSAATVRAYQRRGWDTEHYLIRTGESAKLQHRFDDRGLTLTVSPVRPKILGYHVPKSRFRGQIEWVDVFAPDASGRSLASRVTELFGKALSKMK